MSNTHKFQIIGRVTQPDETQIITIQQIEPPISGHWTAVVSTDGVSDRIIAPSGRFIAIGGTQPNDIPHGIWGFLADVV